MSLDLIVFGFYLVVVAADGLFIVQLQAALAYFEAAVEVRGP